MINDLVEPIMPQGGIILRSTSLDPIKFLEIVGDEEFERIVEQWAFYLFKKKQNKDVKVIRIGGPGDKGRDIGVYENDGTWINYQCKKYAKKLSKKEILIEVGKICYYCKQGSITPPKENYIFSPKGVTPNAWDILNSKENLKKELISNWDNSCCKSISTSGIPLTDELKSYLESFDFSVFKLLDIKDFIEQYKETPYFSYHFGILSKPRPISKRPPEEIMTSEGVYIKKILDAYADYLGKDAFSSSELDKNSDLKKDFEEQRAYFYEAESLEQFSRDIDPEMEQFNSLKNDIYEGVLEKIREDCQNGFERLKKVLSHSSLVQIRPTLVSSQASNSDKKGICHHLANEKLEIKWKR
jgi:hypothetical protein